MAGKLSNESWDTSERPDETARRFMRARAACKIDEVQLPELIESREARCVCG